MHTRNSLIVAAAAILLCSCNVKDDIADIAQIALPAGMNITVLDGDGNPVPGAPGSTVDVPDGTYTLVATQNTDGMTLDKTIAWLPVSPSGEVPAAPTLMADVLTLTVKAGDVITPQFNLRRLARRVQVEAVVKGIAPEDITDFTLTLHAVANTVDLSGIFGSAWAQLHTRSTVGDDFKTRLMLDYKENLFSGGGNLLGFQPYEAAQQNYKATFNFSAGGHDYQHIIAGYEGLASFNSGNPIQPVHLAAELVVDIALGTLTATIVDWKPGWQGELEGDRQ